MLVYQRVLRFHFWQQKILIADARSVGPRIPQVAVSAGEARGTTGP